MSGAIRFVRINERGVATPYPVAIGDRIGIGDLTLVIELVGIEVTAPDVVEDDLIRSIETERDIASREVYADWLEEHGQPARAEFVRLQLRAVELAAHSYDQAQVRLRELATAVDPRWRVRIACPRIDCTVVDPATCPYHWGALEPTENPSVRWCRTCECDVHYCFSTNEVRAHRGERDRVARDLLLDEGDDRDLLTGRLFRCSTCGFDLRKVNRNNQICPRCNARVG